MSLTVSFWKRLGRSLHARGNGASAPRVTQQIVPLQGDWRPNGRRFSFPWPRRSQEAEAARYQRVTELISALGAHFERQDARAAELNAAVNRVAGMLQKLAETQERQGDQMTAMAGHLEGLSRDARTTSLSIREVPGLLAVQADVMRTVAQQLAAARESDARLGDSIDGFSDAVSALRESGETQTRALRESFAASQASSDTLAATLRRQNRYVLLALAAAALVGLVGLAGLLTVLT